MQDGIRNEARADCGTFQVNEALLAEYLAAPRRRRMPVDKTPYEEDEACQRFVADHPGGATLGEIAEYMGVTRERVRQIEFGALKKLAKMDCGVLTAFFDPHEDRSSL